MRKQARIGYSVMRHLLFHCTVQKSWCSTIHRRIVYIPLLNVFFINCSIQMKDMSLSNIICLVYQLRMPSIWDLLNFMLTRKTLKTSYYEAYLKNSAQLPYMISLLNIVSYTAVHLPLKIACGLISSNLYNPFWKVSYSCIGPIHCPVCWLLYWIHFSCLLLFFCVLFWLSSWRIKFIKFEINYETIPNA